MTWVRRENSRKPKHTWHYLGLTVEANTKSEARSLLKKKMGALGVGARILKVETKGEGK